MASKNGKPTKLVHRYECEQEAKWGGFINVRMTDQMIHEYEAWLSELKVPIAVVAEEVLAHGMKVGFTFDHANNCTICSFTGRLVAESQDRYSVNSRANDMETALALMLWKHYFAVKGDYGNYRPKTDSGFSWG